MTLENLLELMDTSRSANVSTGLNGLLLYRPGGFLQVLEGGQDAVERLYASIEQDGRHDDVTLVRTRTQPSREFPDWRMGFGAIDSGSLTASDGGVGPGPTESEAGFVRSCSTSSTPTPGSDRIQAELAACTFSETSSPHLLTDPVSRVVRDLMCHT